MDERPVQIPPHVVLYLHEQLLLLQSLLLLLLLLKAFVTAPLLHCLYRYELRWVCRVMLCQCPAFGMHVRLLSVLLAPLRCAWQNVADCNCG